jgi:aspartyl-tRNA(Asn)/glutamyl-tRNA(Gln) amidotransferase subunit C
MYITKDTVLKTAKLARLRMSDEKVSLYTCELSKVLEVIDQLKSAETEGVKPLVNVNEFDMLLREDRIQYKDCSEEVLKNAPKEKFGYFAVPKVIE